MSRCPPTSTLRPSASSDSRAMSRSMVLNVALAGATEPPVSPGVSRRGLMTGVVLSARAQARAQPQPRQRPARAEELPSKHSRIVAAAPISHRRPANRSGPRDRCYAGPRGHHAHAHFSACCALAVTFGHRPGHQSPEKDTQKPPANGDEVHREGLLARRHARIDGCGPEGRRSRCRHGLYVPAERQEGPAEGAA